MFTTLVILGILGFYLLIMLCVLSKGSAGGLIMLVFIVPLLYALKNHLEEQERLRKHREEARLKAEEQARQERARREWEQTLEGRAYLEERRLEREASDRLEKQRRQEEAEEAERVRREQEEELARTKWRLFHESKTTLEIHAMTGSDFEQFLARLLTKMGYTNLSLTPANDQGGDIVCDSPERVRTVVQAKRWKKPLGNAVVQEVLGAMLHYDCPKGLIITNSTFTAPARILAAKDPRVTLCDGRWLDEQVRRHLPPLVPEFNWTDYNQYVKENFPLRARVASQTPTGRPSRPRKTYRRRRRRWRR